MTSSSRSIIKPGSNYQAERFSFPVQIPTVSAGARNKREDKRPPKEEASAPAAAPPQSESLKRVSAPESEQIRRRAEREAGEILKRAREQAEEILEEAREQAQKLQAEAASSGHAEGYEKGYEAGKADGQVQAVEALREQQDVFRNSLERALRSVEDAKKTCLETYMEQLKECSLAVAEKVICISLKSSGQVIKRMLISQTEKLKKTDWVKIYMEKSDYNMMMEADGDVVNELSKLSDNIKFVVMNKGKTGSCIIEMPEEIVDISVDTQMENIRSMLETIRA